jgi:hypothetical protein
MIAEKVGISGCSYYPNLNNIYLFIYGLFHDIVSSPDYIALNGRMINE